MEADISTLRKTGHFYFALTHAREPGDLWSVSTRWERDRSAKAQSHKADAHALEESDRIILSTNQTRRKGRGPRSTSFHSTLAPTQRGETECTRDGACRKS